MNRSGNARTWLWLTVPTAVLLAIAAGGGLFAEGLYRDNDNILAQAVGQDLVSLAVVLPTLIASAILAGRGSTRGWLVWLGVLAYLVYSYVTYAFAVRFNTLFLVYVALLGLSLYALIGGLATADPAAIKAGFTPKTPVRAVGIYLMVVAALFYFVWLSEVVPALLAGAVPQSILEDGTPTNAVHVVDMAWLLPAFVITAVMLRRKQALGYTLAGVLLTQLTFLVLAILSMGVFQMLQGIPGGGPMVVLFAVLSAASLGMLLWYVHGLESSPIRRARPIAVRPA